ncbi:MAG: iron chaperone [Sphaerochaeta sp.]|uniref:iron chaperone n=1 Tax=Sphaerochaeta sp. TaxID=1972642 RepID=UPI003D114153
MEEFETYLASIPNAEHSKQLRIVLEWVLHTFSNLKPRFAWGQPMFTDHGTFILGFSAAQKHFAIAPEGEGIRQFSEKVIAAGYEHSVKFIRIKWEQPVNYALLEEIIRFNMADKADCTTFWRK